MKFRHIMTFSLLCAVLPLGCAKQEIAEPEVDPAGEEQVEEPYSYDFAIDSEDTKTVFGEDHMVWEEGDLVGYYFEHSGSQSANRSAEVWKNTDGKAYVTIRSSVALAKGDMVYAYYPYSSDNDGKKASEVTLELVRNQNPADGDSMPMVALPYTIGNTSSDENDCRLRFLSLGSIVKVNIYSSNTFYQNEPINSVCFDAESPVSGTFTYNTTTPSLSNVPAITGLAGEDVTASPEGASVGTTLEDAASFLFVVAPGSYKGKIVVTTSRATYTYISSSTRDYARATVKPFNIDLERSTWTPNVVIDTPQKLINFLSTTNENDGTVYDITEDLDMTGYTISSATNFGGTLNGNNHSISNLDTSVPMFESNSGSISDLTFDESCDFIVSTSGDYIFAPLVRNDNGGTYTNVVNKGKVLLDVGADEAENPMIVGGLVAISLDGTFDGCKNFGAVEIDATNHSMASGAIGGLVGYIKDGSFSHCENSGEVSLTAKWGDPLKPYREMSYFGINAGGIVGLAADYATTSATQFEYCYNQVGGTVKLNHRQLQNVTVQSSKSGYVAVGGIAGRARGHMKQCRNFALIDVFVRSSNDTRIDKLRNYLLYTGGIAGTGRWALSFDSCINEGDIRVRYDGGNNDSANRYSAVGGICGSQDPDNDATSNPKAGLEANYCKVRNCTIDVGGLGVLDVGGIYGLDGTQIGNQVDKTCLMNVDIYKGNVGGLVGHISGNAQYRQIKSSTSAASISVDCTATSSTNISTGGLVGSWDTGSTTSYPCFISRQGEGCSFSGNINTNLTHPQVRTGMVIGYGNMSGNKGRTVVLGETDYKIFVSGTISKKGVVRTPVTSENVDVYKSGGYRDENTLTVEAEGPQSLKLMSFNISSGSQWTDARKAAIAEMFADQLPDVVGLQGVRTASWSDVDASAAGYTGYFPDSGPNNAFLFRTARVTASGMGYFELRDDSCEPGVSWDGYVRDVIYATLHDESTGQDWFCVSTHLPVNNLDDAQVKAVNLILDRISVLNTGNYPVILIGDFNCVDSSEACTILKSSMNNTRTFAKNYVDDSNKLLYTYNAYGDTTAARNMIDHIWVSSSIPYVNMYFYLTLTQEIKEYGTDVPYLSDHYPVITYLNPLDL